MQRFLFGTTMIFSRLQFIIPIIWVLAASKIFVYAFSNNVTDQEALLSFKASITDDSLGALSSWNNSIHFCHWKGVTCNSNIQRATALNLSSQHLVGTLSSHIGNLSFLKALDLDRNNLHGSIPNEIDRLFHLEYLSLANNSFQGEFPSNFSHCVNIRSINMYGNDLEGKLPAQFAYWSKLNVFNLGNNHFIKSIPPSVGNISSLRLLLLGGNNLTGCIPLEVSHLTKLEILDLSTNSFWGIVPLPLYNISSLYTIVLTNNELEGTLPADLGFTLPMLKWFYVGWNRFLGPLPQSITNASNLVVFDIRENNITGPIPMNLGSLSSLERLYLGRNPLGDNHLTNNWSFFNSLVNCTHLKRLSLYKNGLIGELPHSIVNLSTTIEIIALFGNHIYGSIPDEIGKLVNLKVLALYDNFLIGTIPESIGELSMMGKLILYKNNISGVIPSSIGNITQLVDLYLDNNMFQGSIPTSMFNISSLQLLSLYSNHLNGVIPEQIVRLSSQCSFLYLHQNLFTGSLPSNIGSFKQLVLLDVSNNKLTGDIPPTLGECVMLEELHMEGNLFEGRIPSSFKALKSLRIMDLSSNSISGNIPSFFDGFRLIEVLNLSNNKLVGEVPQIGLFSNVSAFTVTGNLRLCGGIQALQLPSCPVKTSRTKKNTFFLRIILLLVLPLAVLLPCLSFIVYQQRKSKSMNVPVPILHANKYPRLSYQDLLLATNEFSSNNLLGGGRYGLVYKGNLESLETVAVKVLNVEVCGANKSFLTECETLKNIRHRNLIKIITTCSSTDFKGNDFKALVFEFMTNGSLDSWLHPSPSYQGNERNLTLLERLNISIDVALGLDYLHHHSYKSIIHCDIKPSTILLDEEFVARVGDFGLARFCFAITSDINQPQTSSTGIRGTLGYVPPEYGMSEEISTEGDVYSYGILLLEIFSGKRPTCSSILMNNANNLHDYVRKALPHRVMDIADPRIVLDQKDHGLTAEQSYDTAAMEVCLASIFEVGILCSVETPRERIDISVAMKQLYVAKDKLLQHGE